jgi:hypothetical protein
MHSIDFEALVILSEARMDYFHLRGQDYFHPRGQDYFHPHGHPLHLPCVKSQNIPFLWHFFKVFCSLKGALFEHFWSIFY